AAGCVSSGGHAVKQTFDREIAAQGLSDQMQACSVGCLRLCCAGPLVQIDPSQAMFEEGTPAHVPSILASLKGGSTNAKRGNPQSPFFKKQMPIVLENSGIVEPERIESYIAAGGYQALHRAIHEMQQAEVVDAITKSGLRG